MIFELISCQGLGEAEIEEAYRLQDKIYDQMRVSSVYALTPAVQSAILAYEDYVMRALLGGSVEASRLVGGVHVPCEYVCMLPDHFVRVKLFLEVVDIPLSELRTLDGKRFAVGDHAWPDDRLREFHDRFYMFGD